jgi:hypothetical protein
MAWCLVEHRDTFTFQIAEMTLLKRNVITFKLTVHERLHCPLSSCGQCKLSNMCIPGTRPTEPGLDLYMGSGDG